MTDKSKTLRTAGPRGGRRKNWRLSPDEITEAREAFNLLEGTGLKLTDAVRVALQLPSVVDDVSDCTLMDAVNRFLKYKYEEVRLPTWMFYRSHLEAFADVFPDMELASIRREHVRSFCTTAHKWRAVRALFRWAAGVEPSLITKDPTQGLKLSFKESRVIEFLSVDEAALMLENGGKYRSTFALMLFAGIRPMEIRSPHKPPLLWRHVNTDERFIRIEAGTSKTGRVRIIERLPDNLWSWLEPGAHDEPVCPHERFSLIERAKVILGRQGNWPHDATRHTFATYHVAAFGDPGKTALILGHEGSLRMLYNHYRGLATQRQGEAFFALRGK